MTQPFLIGMDGGGTATVIYVANTETEVLFQMKCGPLNRNGQGSGKVDDVFLEIEKKLQENEMAFSDCKGICIGAAGISNPESKRQIEEILQKLGMTGKVKLVGDHETALAGAIEGNAGIILIAGTGSICYGKTENEKTYRAGGYGHIIDDAGSAYAIGRDILKAIMHAKDGRGRETLLTQLVKKQLSIETEEELIAWLYAQNRSKKEIAGLAILLEEAIEKEDNIAKEIANKAANDLAALAVALIEQMKELPPLVVSGSVLMKNEGIFNEFSTLLKRKYAEITILKMQGNAAEGALKLIKE